MAQLPLLDEIAREERPWKRARNVSRQQVTIARESGQLQARQQEFLLLLAAHKNRFNVAPTIAELTAWAYGVGRLPRNDPNLLRPRATECGPGERRWRKGAWVTKGGGLIEFLPVRKCAQTGKAAHPIRLTER